MGTRLGKEAKVIASEQTLPLRSILDCPCGVAEDAAKVRHLETDVASGSDTLQGDDARLARAEADGQVEVIGDFRLVVAVGDQAHDRVNAGAG